jgi:hypothetical protein
MRLRGRAVSEFLVGLSLVCFLSMGPSASFMPIKKDAPKSLLGPRKISIIFRFSW